MDEDKNVNENAQSQFDSDDSNVQIMQIKTAVYHEEGNDCSNLSAVVSTCDSPFSESKPPYSQTTQFNEESQSSNATDSKQSRSEKTKQSNRDHKIASRMERIQFGVALRKSSRAVSKAQDQLS